MTRMQAARCSRSSRRSTSVVPSAVRRTSPAFVIDSDADDSQAYFWTPEWQEGERRAHEDIAAGRVHRFDSLGDLLESLHADD